MVYIASVSVLLLAVTALAWGWWPGYPVDEISWPISTNHHIRPQIGWGHRPVLNGRWNSGLSDEYVGYTPPRRRCPWYAKSNPKCKNGFWNPRGRSGISSYYYLDCPDRRMGLNCVSINGVIHPVRW